MCQGQSPSRSNIVPWELARQSQALPPLTLIVRGQKLSFRPSQRHDQPEAINFDKNHVINKDTMAQTMSSVCTTRKPGSQCPPQSQESMENKQHWGWLTVLSPAYTKVLSHFLLGEISKLNFRNLTNQ